MSESELNIFPGEMATLGGDISDYAAKYIEKINETTTIVNNLSAVWGGPTYDTFKSGYDSKLSALEELNDILRKMSNKVDETATEGEAMINTITSQVE